MLRIGNGILKTLSRAFSQFDAFIMESIEDAKVFEGIVWSVRRRYTIAASGVLNIIMDPTGFTGSELVCQPLAFDAIGGPFSVDVYRGATANNDGTLINPYNKDFSILTNGEVIFRANPTGIVTGSDKPVELLIPSDGTGVVGAAGSAAGDKIVTRIDTSKKYLIRITNTDGTAAGNIGIKVDHFEVR